jgi:hypothetical protein
LKRFVNIYRLLKASLPADEESGFMEVQGASAFAAPYQIVLWLLALANGLHRFSDSLFTAVLALPSSPTPRAPSQVNLGSLMDALKGDLAAPAQPTEMSAVLTYPEIRLQRPHWLAALEGFEPLCVDFEPVCPHR